MKSSGETFAQFKSFNLTACGVMMSCDEGGGVPLGVCVCVCVRVCETNDWTENVLCGCRGDFLDQMLSSQRRVSTSCRKAEE